MNPRSFEKTALAVLKEASEMIFHKRYNSLRGIYDHCSGIYYDSKSDPIWLVDIDGPDMDDVDGICELISEISTYPLPVVAKIPSNSGLHVLSHPFNLHEFKIAYPAIEVHKDNPTNLYVP
jgi:hypothetical protein